MRGKTARDDFITAPIEANLPPFNTTLNLFHAVVHSKITETELGTKHIFKPMEHSSMTMDWIQLNKNNKILSKLFNDSNKIIKENKACCSRFREKIKDNLYAKVHLEGEIMNVKCEIREYKNIKNEMENYVEEYSLYEKFLREIAQESAEFNSVGDVLNRYETLEHTKKECARLVEEGLEEATELRRQMTRLVEDQSNSLKKLNNKLIMIQVRHKEARERRKYWENTLHKIEALITSKETKKINLGGASWDLYRQMCRRRALVPTAGERDINAHMDFIKKTFMFYKEVITAAATAKQAHASEMKPTLHGQVVRVTRA